MRVLALTNAYPPHYYGGYELTCHDVMTRFTDRGATVMVLTSTARRPGVVDAPEPHVSRRLRAFWDWNENLPATPRSPLGWLRAERRNRRSLCSALDSFAPDVVSVWNLCALSTSALPTISERRIPLVLTVANDWPQLAPHQDPWARLVAHAPATRVAAQRRWLAAFHGSWVNYASDFVRRQTPKHISDRFAASEVIHPGIDTTDFPVTTRAAQPWRWRLLYVGRIDEGKGLGTLIAALPRLPETTVVRVVGTGGERYLNELRRRAQNLGVGARVTFETLDRPHIRSAYEQADVTVFPSEWEEPFGLVPLESMASSTPVISTLRGGSAEFLVRGQNCLTFTPGDATELSAAVRRLANDAPLRRRLVEGGRATAERLTVDRYAEDQYYMHVQAIGQRRKG